MSDKVQRAKRASKRPTRGPRSSSAACEPDSDAELEPDIESESEADDWNAAFAAFKDREARGVQSVFQAHLRARVRGKAIVDYGGQIGLEAGIDYVPPAESETKAGRRRRALRNAQGLVTLLREGENRGCIPEQILRAVDGMEAAVRHYFKPDENPRAHVREVVVLLEFLRVREPDAEMAKAARFIHRHCAYDKEGLALVPVEAWQAAIEQWQGMSRSRARTRGGRPRPDEYDWRNIVLDLIDHIPSGRKKRAEARRWVDRVMQGELPIARAPSLYEDDD